jgi:cytochrome c553
MNKYLIIAISIAASALSACTVADRSRALNNPNIEGKTIAQQVCSSCHGEDGNSHSAQYPKLAGQQTAYVVSQLNNFASHVRTDRLALEVMAGMSSGLNEKQKQEIAEYFYQQTPSNTSLYSGDTSLGKQIYNLGIQERSVMACAACHGELAQGQQIFPRLAGQHKEYLLKQLHVFKNTHARPDTPMAMVTQNLSEKEMEQVANYLSTMK